MKHILVNGLNSKTGGGKSILNNYLKLLRTSTTEFKYFVLTPNKSEYDHYENEFITVVDIADFYKKNSLFILLYNFGIPALLRKYRIDLVLNLADIPIPTKRLQVFLFDWAYAVYPNSTVWKMMDFKSWLTRKMKLLFFNRYIEHATVLLAQTEVIRERLIKYYDFKNVKVVPNAVSLDNLELKDQKDFQLKGNKNLLYLSYYYPHKNYEIFLPLAQKIKAAGKDYKIIITIDENQHPHAKLFLDNVTSLGLSDVIINVGPVSMNYVPSLYQQADGLIMPTLLESFSGTYVEAMFHKIPIFTSDFDFAEGLCKDAGFYFDPFDEVSILNQLDKAFETEGLIEERTKIGSQILEGMSDWDDTFLKIQTTIDETIESN